MHTFGKLGKSHPIVELSKNNYQRDDRPSLFNACNGPYALCTSAACQVDASGNEICYCDVLNGTSISLLKRYRVDKCPMDYISGYKLNESMPLQ